MLFRSEDVGGGDEEDFGEVEGNVQVVVAVGGILFGIEDFEEGAGRVATEIAAQATRTTGLRIPDRGRMPMRSSACHHLSWKSAEFTLQPYSRY